jgi:hypothetical protein
MEVMQHSLQNLFGANSPEQLILKLKEPRPRGYKLKKGGN